MSGLKDISTSKLIGMIAVALSCAAIGYVIPLENVIEKPSSTVVAPGGGGGGGYVAATPTAPKPKKARKATDKIKIESPSNEEAPAAVEEPVVMEQTEEAPVVDEQPRVIPLPKEQPAEEQLAENQAPKFPAVEQPAEQPAVEQQPVEAPVEEPTVEEVDATPKIARVVVAERDSRRYKMVGVKVTASAKCDTGDAVTYKLTDGEATYTSSNGVFKEVKPNNSGKFTLVVTNTKTGQTAEKVVTNANLKKLKRMTAAELAEELNSLQQSRLFMLHFDHDNLKINYTDETGMATADSVSGINALVAEKNAQGWLLVVEDNIRYDDYNRIVSFSTIIKYQE